jgi:hypothetical protein
VLAAALIPFVAPSVLPGSEGEIRGTVLNGTRGRVPIADAEVVLRASHEGALVPIHRTTTDAGGRFVFRNLPLGTGAIYLPGANRAGVHYPGRRVRLDGRNPRADVELLAYEAVESPSPLVVRRHELRVRAETGLVEIAETMEIDNPSRSAYVGEPSDHHQPVTLRISLPTGFETVTFDEEFHGRAFQIHGGDLITSLPWPPGSRELKFTYHLPVEQRRWTLSRAVDLPTQQLVVRASTAEGTPVACNLSSAGRAANGEWAFEHRGEALPAGYLIELTLGSLPLRLETYSRWAVLASLLVLGTWLVAKKRRPKALASVFPTIRASAARCPADRRSARP